MKKILLLLFFASVQHALAQPAPCLAWQKCLGNTNGDDGVSVAATPDGGFIVLGDAQQITGCTGSGGGSFVDVMITKWDANFNLQWQQCFAGTNADMALKIIPVSAGGYLVMGFTGSTPFEGQNAKLLDIFISRLDNNGNKLWTKVYGGSFVETAGAFGSGGTDGDGDVIENTDGTFTFITSTNSNDGDVTGKIGPAGDFDIWIVKISATGSIIWAKCYGGTSSDQAIGITRTTDGGYLALGCTHSNDIQVSGNHGLSDLWLFKINSTGVLQWQKCLGGTGNDNKFYSGSASANRGNIITASDGAVYFMGSTDSNNGDVTGNHGGLDIWVVKTDQAGNLVWKKCYGGTGTESIGKLMEDTDGHIVISGSSNSADGDVPANYGSHDVFVFKVDRLNGNLLWSKNYGGALADAGSDIVRVPQKGLVLTGITRSNNIDVSGNLGGADIWLLRLDFINPTLPVPVTSPVAPAYCTTQLPVTVKLLNPPPPAISGCSQAINTSVSVLLDNSTPLAVAPDSTFILNIPALAAGSHIVTITYSAGSSQQAATINFSVNSVVTPQTDITASPANALGNIPFTAVNVTGGGTTPLYTFANDRNFSSLIQSESTSNTAVKLNTTFPVGINWVYVRLKTSAPCYTSLTDVDSVSIPIPALPQTSAVLSEYCGSLGLQTVTITNMPIPAYQATVTVKLDNTPLALSGNQFSFNVSLLTAGAHLLQVQYANSFITQTTSIPFSVKRPLAPQVSLTASTQTVSPGSPAIVLTAQPSDAGVSPLYTFARDSLFTQLLAPESAANTAVLQPASLRPGENAVYVRLRTTETCRINETAVSRIFIWKNGHLQVVLPGNNTPVSIYPNPFSTNIFITGLSAREQYVFRLYDEKGRTVYRLNVQNQATAQLATERLAAGSYLLSIYTTAQKKPVATLKLLKN